MRCRGAGHWDTSHMADSARYMGQAEPSHATENGRKQYPQSDRDVNFCVNMEASPLASVNIYRHVKIRMGKIVVVGPSRVNREV